MSNNNSNWLLTPLRYALLSYLHISGTSEIKKHTKSQIPPKSTYVSKHNVRQFRGISLLCCYSTFLHTHHFSCLWVPCCFQIIYMLLLLLQSCVRTRAKLNCGNVLQCVLYTWPYNVPWYKLKFFLRENPFTWSLYIRISITKSEKIKGRKILKVTCNLKLNFLSWYGTSQFQNYYNKKKFALNIL